MFGRIVEVIRDNDHWNAFYIGNEGKKRLAKDIVIPSEVRKEDIVDYVADLCHEWATPVRNEVKMLD